jgi:dihydroflavonol-4-reductase
MQVFVTGGTGFIGSHSVAALVRAGHSVRLLVRDQNKVAPALGPLGVAMDKVDVVVGDITDAAFVERAIAGCNGVLHAASVYSFDSRDHRMMREVNAKGTETVLAAAHKVGADPIVYVSSYLALVPTGGRALATDLPVGKPRERYMATKAEAEVIARRFQEEGAPVTITYPMATLGPNDPHLGDQTSRIRNILMGLMPMFPTGGFPISDVRDVADLHARLMQPGQGPRRVLTPGQNVSTRQLVRSLRQVTGRRIPTLFLPAVGMLPVGLLTKYLQRVSPVHIPAEYGAIYACYVNSKLDDKAAGPSRPLAETMTDAVRSLYTGGQLSKRAVGKVASTERVPV